MKKKNSEKAYFIQRLLAFVIDIFIVAMIASLITTPFIDTKENKKLNKETNQLLEKVRDNEITNEEFVEQNIDLSYQNARVNGLLSLVMIICNILYFVVYQLYNKGQTIGKKLMKIKIESDNGELFMNQMIFRAFIANFILVDIICFIFMLSNSRTTYFYGMTIFQSIQYLITLISIFMILIRKDGCAVHDKLVHTRVVRD